METIGLIAAMPSESGALLKKVRGWKRTRVGSFRGFGFKMTNRNCILLTSGMGVRRAAEATHILIEKLHPACVISFGIAGAVREDLKIGDVIMATQSCILDKGVLSQFKFLSTLSDAAQETVEQALRHRGARLVPGTAITTRGTQLVLQQPKEVVNPILEMETAGILSATEAGGIPLVVIRSVSDGPLAPLPFDLEKFMDHNNNLRLGRLLLAVIKNPRLLIQSGQMRKNSRIAADNAAIVVVAILSQLLPLLT